MDITIDKKSPIEASIKITLKEADYQPKVEEKIKEYSKKANIKGFRPGKVPAGVIKRMYGKGILVEEINSLLSTSLRKYIDDEKLEILGEPLPNMEEAEKIDWDNQKDFEFTYDLGLVDDFKLDLTKKTKVTDYQIKVTEKEIDETIDRLKKQFGETIEAETSDKNDDLSGKLVAIDGHFEKDVIINVSDVEKSAQKLFIGTKVNDTIEFDIEKAFKDVAKRAEISATSEEEAKSLKGKFNFTVTKINRTKEAEINQDLFDKTFGKDTVKDEASFRDKVKEALQDSYIKETSTFLNNEIKKTLLDKTKINLPEDFLKRWLKASNQEITDDVIAKEFDIYTADLKWNLIKNKVANELEIKVDHQDVIDETKDMIRAQFGSMGMSEQMEANIDSFADNYLKGEEGKNYMNMFEQLRDKKVTEGIKEKIEIKVKETDVDGFKKAIEN